jgi:endonuclease/exonuclease/phosphatase family metal-dependent hydrolase
VVTYNIQQGYSDDMEKNFAGQLEMLQQIDADIIGLQESDNARINGGNADVVRYLADKLDMYSYYGPKTVTGTFGDALLSKYPIENATSHYLYSDGEQVAVVEAQVTAGDHTYNIYVNHFGNTCRFPDQEQQLAGLQQLLAGKENVIVMGDFNFGRNVVRESCTPEELQIMQGFQDQLLATGLDEDDACGRVVPNDGLDHIFVSQGMSIVSECIDDPASDHPLLWARLQPAG